MTYYPLGLWVQPHGSIERGRREYPKCGGRGQDLRQDRVWNASIRLCSREHYGGLFAKKSANPRISHGCVKSRDYDVVGWRVLVLDLS